MRTELMYVFMRWALLNNCACVALNKGPRSHGMTKGAFGPEELFHSS